MARFYPLFSGSSGNSVWFGHGDGGILIDVGMSAKKTEEALCRAQIPSAALNGIFITHEHIDHVRGLRVFTKKHPVPVYATAGTATALISGGLLNPETDLRVIEGTVEVGGMAVTPFPTSHDCRESCGYTVTFPDGRTAALVTDLGYVSEQVREAAAGKDLVMVESNHDVRMLQNGPYPYSLKQRILSNVGHLSNDACASELPEWIRRGTTRFVLAHLSKENNLPQLAYISALSALQLAGMKENLDFQLFVAPRENAGGKLTIF